MTFKWLESKATAMLFFCSAAVFSSLCAFAFLIAIPLIRQFLNTSWANQPAVILFAALVVLSMPSVVVLFGGMAIFCACVDHCSISAKVLWFALFLVTGPIGSTAYYFVKYRGYLKRKGLGEAPQPIIAGE